MDNRSLQRTLADNPHTDCHNNREDIDMRQCHFVHGIQHLPHRDLGYKVSNVLQDNQLEFKDHNWIFNFTKGLINWKLVSGSLISVSVIRLFMIILVLNLRGRERARGDFLTQRCYCLQKLFSENLIVTRLSKIHRLTCKYFESSLVYLIDFVFKRIFMTNNHSPPVRFKKNIIKYLFT